MHQECPRILLIDDNRHGLIVRRDVLEERGYAVETACGGREGLEKFDQQPFDLVVTDYRMSDISGLEVIASIRGKNDRVPIVVLSGYAEKLGLTRQSTGADAVLAKGPTEAQDLVRTIARLVKKKPGSAAARAMAAGASGTLV